MTRTLILMLCLAAPAVRADEPVAPAPADRPPAAQVHGRVVAVDVEAKVLRVAAEPEELALGVEGDAVAALAGLQAGDVVTATCREGTSGSACVVTAIAKADAS